MKIGFDTIREQVTSLDEFPLQWRFTQEKYDVLPEIHREQLKSLNKAGSNFLWNYISTSGLHQDTPFKKGFFTKVDKAKIFDGNEKEIKKWLYQRGIPFDKEVYLSWQPDEAMIVPWKILIKYFDSFYYADDLTIIDDSLNWALLFYHEDEIYFGTNEKYEPSKTFENIDFIWG